MQFVKILQPCHPEAIILQPKLNIYCSKCEKEVIPNIYDYIRQSFDDHFYASTLAQAYYAWTGDEKTPLPFTVIDIEGILPKRVTSQTICQVRECVQLLRALNAPFTTDMHPRMVPSMKTFLSDYLKAVSVHGTPNMPLEQQMLNHLVQGMYQVLQSKEFPDPFELYFMKLVPFTQQCLSNWKPLPSLPENENLAKELLIQLQRSNVIRKMFGRFSIPFDVMHAMVASFACSADKEAVGNWVLDFMARLCRGEYFWKKYNQCEFVRKMIRFLYTKVTRRNNLLLYQVMNSIREGKAVDCLSNSWIHYLQLTALVGKKFNVSSNQIVNDMACHQMFPAVLFQDNADHLGFTLASAHVLYSFDPKKGLPAKGEFKKARKIHHIVKQFIEKISNFGQMLWTLETLQMFLAAEPDLEKTIAEAVEMILTTEEE